MKKEIVFGPALPELKRLLAAHAGQRVCVLGTMCCGKTTLLSEIPEGVDMDTQFGPALSAEEIEFITRTPWTEEIGETVDRLIKERVKVTPGAPLFGTVIVDCDVIIYLDISEEPLARRCEKRGADFSDALNMKKSVEDDIRSYRLDNDITYYKIQIDA